MIPEEKQDLAVEYAFGMMDAEGEREFELQMLVDEELRAFTKELRDTAAAVAHDAPQLTPPPALREQILSTIRVEAASQEGSNSSANAPSQGSGAGFLPWAVAAGLAITTGALWMEREQMKKDVVFWKEETIRIRTLDHLKEMKIATLTAQNEAFAKAGAVVVWDAKKQEGIVKLSNFPAVKEGKDYQLWVIDPRYPQPVSAGVVTVSAEGVSHQEFTPGKPIGKDNKFAISIEKEGGSPVPSDVILVGD